METQTTMNDTHTIDRLRADLAAIESGDTETLHFAAGHGIQSRRWRFAWENGNLSIDFDLPLGRVLSDEEAQAADRGEIAAAIRMALVLLSVGPRSIDPACRLSVTHDGETAAWRLISGDGEIIEEADDWTRLSAKLDDSMPSEGAPVVIWP